MANAELQRWLEGKTSDRNKSIAEIAKELGITEEQCSAIQGSLVDLGN
jgi:hypothetical protein